MFQSSLVDHTNKKISDIAFNSEVISKVISGLNLNKTHVHDMICIRVLKICGESIHKRFE